MQPGFSVLGVWIVEIRFMSLWGFEHFEIQKIVLVRDRETVLPSKDEEHMTFIKKFRHKKYNFFLENRHFIDKKQRQNKNSNFWLVWLIFCKEWFYWETAIKIFFVRSKNLTTEKRLTKKWLYNVMLIP